MFCLLAMKVDAGADEGEETEIQLYEEGQRVRSHAINVPERVFCDLNVYTVRSRRTAQDIFAKIMMGK